MLKRILGEKEYAGLRSFFIDTWESGDSQYSYLVYFAQKARNLNEVFYQIEYDTLLRNDPMQANRLKRIRGERFVSQTGMYLQAPVLADKYKENGSFPQILLIDELVRSGKDYAEFFYSLERHILSVLKETGWQSTENSTRALHAALADAIEFRVYLCTQEILLLEGILRKRLKAVKYGDKSQLYTFAADVTAAVTASQLVENTDFTPSLYISADMYQKADSALNSSPKWRRQVWNYQDEESVIWYQRIPIHGEIQLYYAVRARHLFRDSKYSLTAYVFWGETGRGVFTDLISDFKKRFQAAGCYDAFCEILNQAPSFYEVHTSFVSSLLSLLVELSFLQDAECLNREWTHDLEKVCQSYGFIGSPDKVDSDDSRVLISNFRSLIIDHKLCETLLAAAQLKLSGRSDRPLSHFSEEQDKITYNQYMWNAENHFIDIDLRQNASIVTRRQEAIPFVDWSKFGNVADCSLERYLKSFPEGYVSFEKKIGALLVLYQHGLIGYKKSIAVMEDETEYAFLQNVGEPSEILIYQHMYRFIPALIYLERVCRRNGLGSVNMAGWFGRELEKDGGEPGLGKLFSDYLDRLHKHGLSLHRCHSYRILSPSKPNKDSAIRTIREWDGKPWPTQEESEFRTMSRLDYLVWEREQEDYYLEKAKAFFDRFK